MTRLPTLACAAVLLHGVSSVQTSLPPAPQSPPVVAVPVPTPEDIAAERERARMSQEYWFGDADAAVAYFARTLTWPSSSYSSSSDGLRDLVGVRGYAPALVQPLLSTEIGMHRRTFGKYAMSAPIEAAGEVVGLNGAFEMNSFMLYRYLDDLLHSVRNEVFPRNRDLSPRSPGEVRAVRAASPVRPEDRALVEEFFREWHVVTVSYCARWQLNCADTLLASAEERFGEAVDVLVLAASAAESRQELTTALAILRRAVKTDPNSVAAHLRLGRLLLAQGRTADAQTALDRALTLARAAHHDASRVLALESLAEIDRRAGRTARARERTSDAAALAPFASPLFAGMSPAEIYGAGLFHEQPRRLAALRTLVRPQAPK